MLDTPPARFQRKAEFAHNACPVHQSCVLTMWQARLTHPGDVSVASDALTA